MEKVKTREKLQKGHMIFQTLKKRRQQPYYAYVHTKAQQKIHTAKYTVPLTPIQHVCMCVTDPACGQIRKWKCISQQCDIAYLLLFSVCITLTNIKMSIIFLDFRSTQTE